MVAVDVSVFALGVLLVAATVASAVRTVLLPRAVPARLTRTVFGVVRRLLHVRMGRRATYARQDKVMALFAPLGMLGLVFTWLSLVLVGYTAMYWGLGTQPLRRAFTLSGSSLLTLGFARPGDLPRTGAGFTEAAIGLFLLALLITFLPLLYSSFSRREHAVALLEVRAGSPPSGVEMLQRFWDIGHFDTLSDEWTRWEAWFVELQETHTSFPSLVFFRSPLPAHSWVNAAGAVLDAASLLASTVDVRRDSQAELMIRAGYISLRRVCDFFRIEYDPDPRPTDPISITREQYDQAYDRLVEHEVPVRDREQGWRGFAGWRVNYDTPLLALADMTVAAPAPWLPK